MEKILFIREYETNSYSGYEIITDKQSIKLSIDNRQACCENWGYFWCNETPQEFVGANLLNITLTDTTLNEAILVRHVDGSHNYEGDIMFVNIETDQGTLQFVAYNQHNGYYGHTAIVECHQLNEKRVL